MPPRNWASAKEGSIPRYCRIFKDAAGEQKELVKKLDQIVRQTKQFQAAEPEGLTRFATGQKWCSCSRLDF